MNIRLTIATPLLALGLLAAGTACGSDSSGSVAFGGGPASRTSAGRPGSGATTGAASSGGGGGGQNADAVCSRISLSDVAAAAGRDMTTVNGAGGTCVYQGSDPSKPFYFQVLDSPDAMMSILELKPNAIPVNGLGTDAFYVTNAGILFVRNGDHGFLLTDLSKVSLGDNQTVPDSLVQLARKVLAKS